MSIPINPNRKQGYYWVKTEYGNWHIARWNADFGYHFWTVCWHKFGMYDEDFLEINENMIIHQEEKISQ